MVPFFSCHYLVKSSNKERGNCEIGFSGYSTQYGVCICVSQERDTRIGDKKEASSCAVVCSQRVREADQQLVTSVIVIYVTAISEWGALILLKVPTW